MTLAWPACDGLGRALRDDTAAAVAALRTQVDDPIRLGHDVEIVFDHDQGLGAEAFAAADVAENLDIGQEAHLDALHSLTLAGLAAAAGRIEGKSAGREPPNARFGGIRV